MASLKFEDVAEVGSFHTSRGTYLIRVTEPIGRTTILFSGILNEDVDGAPDCYAAFPNINGGLDSLHNAKSDENAPFSALPSLAHHHDWQWVGLVSRTHQQARAEGILARLDERTELAGRNPHAPLNPNPNPMHPPTFPVRRADNAAFYVSTTALVRDATVPDTDTAHWWDASTVSYAALTPPLKRLGVAQGDFGLAIRKDNGVGDAFFYADWGNKEKVGEMSRHLFRTLFPGNDQEGHPVAFIVFPRSGRQPLDTNRDAVVRERLFGLSSYDNAGTMIGLMASSFPVGAIRELHYEVSASGTFTRRADLDAPGYGPSDPTSVQSRTIATALQRWGFNPALTPAREDRLTVPPPPADLLKLKLPKS